MHAARRTRKPRQDALEIPQEQHFVIDGVSWDQYVAIADAFPERPVRVNYDAGWLEIMTVSNSHDRIKMLIDRLVLVLAK